MNIYKITIDGELYIEAYGAEDAREVLEEVDFPEWGFEMRADYVETI
jgi:hypothetical protein